LLVAPVLDRAGERDVVARLHAARGAATPAMDVVRRRRLRPTDPLRGLGPARGAFRRAHPFAGAIRRLRLDFSEGTLPLAPVHAAPGEHAARDQVGSELPRAGGFRSARAHRDRGAALPPGSGGLAGNRRAVADPLGGAPGAALF